MSKKSKNAAAFKRRAEKRRKKDANVAKYAAWRDAGTNTKSKRARSNDRKNRSGGKHKHEVANCGNIGCKSCFPYGFRLIPSKGGVVFLTRK